MIPIFLVIACAVLYFCGGQGKTWWGQTWIRDVLCPVCIFGLCWHLFGWSWWYLPGMVVCYAGLTIGDDVWGVKFYWVPHAFVIGLSMLTVSLLGGLIVTVVVTISTFLASRFANKYGIDVWSRGLMYGAMPVMVKIIS